MMIGNILGYSGGADKSPSYEETVEAEEIFSCDQKLCHRFSHLTQILLKVILSICKLFQVDVPKRRRSYSFRK